jgi:limonene 1,2-monooxygenase
MARYVHPHIQRQSNLQRVASYDDAKPKYATAGESQQAANAEIEWYNPGKSKLTGAKAW